MLKEIDTKKNTNFYNAITTTTFNTLSNLESFVNSEEQFKIFSNYTNYF